MKAIETISLTKTYKNGKKALDELNLSVESGEIFSFMDYENIPDIFKIPVLLNPFSHVTECIRSLMLGTAIDVMDYIRIFAVMLLLCAIMFLVAVNTLKRKAEE